SLINTLATLFPYTTLFRSVLISIISVFVGAVMTLQIAFQLTSDFIPKTIVGAVNRDSAILELSPTICALVLAGKIGSSISSEIEIGRASCRERVKVSVGDV